MKKEDLHKINDYVKRETIKFEADNSIKSKVYCEWYEKFPDEIEMNFDFYSQGVVSYSGSSYLTISGNIDSTLFKISMSLKRLFDSVLKEKLSADKKMINKNDVILDERVEYR